MIGIESKVKPCWRSRVRQANRKEALNVISFNASDAVNSMILDNDFLKTQNTLQVSYTQIPVEALKGCKYVRPLPESLSSFSQIRREVFKLRDSQVERRSPV